MTRIKVAILNDYDVVIAGLAAMLRPYRSQVAAGDVIVSDPRPHTHPLDSPELSWPLRHRGLTVRESEAMALLVLGLRNREIGESMFVSVDTVKTHLRNAYRKLQVRNRAEAVATALEDADFSRRSRDEIIRSVARA